MTTNSIETFSTAVPFVPRYAEERVISPSHDNTTSPELDGSGPLHIARVDVQGECLLRTGQSVLGLTVVTHREGTTLGRVRDLLFNQETHTIQALILGHNEMAGQRYIHIAPWKEVRQLNTERVVVESASSKILLPLGLGGPTISAYQGVTLLTNTCVVDEEGQLLGALSDICFDELTGCIAGYRTSDGFMLDLHPYKQFLPTSLLSDFQ